MINYNWQSLDLSEEILTEAFTHSSLKESKNFERLEFLGDSLIEAKVSDYLFKNYPKASEGELSRWRSALINQDHLSSLAKNLELDSHLRAKKDQVNDLKKNTRIQASLFESLCGAIYIDKGFKETFDFIESVMKDKLDTAEALFKTSDPKTVFQEEAQRFYHSTPYYKTEEISGPSHSPTFKVSVCINDKVIATETGASTKEAQRKAAQQGLKFMEKENGK